MNLRTLPETFAVCRLKAHASVPAEALSARFFAITRTAEELSIVVPEPVDFPVEKIEPGWRCLQVVGPLDFALVGILSQISSTLADAGVSLYAISTYDTDYVLVKADKLGAALAALRRQGYTILV